MTKRKPAIAAHSSESNEHYTPSHIVDACRLVTGAFDLDPFSCNLANETVRAKRIITAEQNAFRMPWFATGKSGGAFVNPPGGTSLVVLPNGKTEEQSNQANAWCETVRWWLSGSLLWAWFVVFNPSAFFQRAQIYARAEKLPVPQDFPRCEFTERIAYLHPADGKRPALPGVDAPKVVPGMQPPHGSALLFLPRDVVQVELFREVFDPVLGDVSVDEWRLERVMRRRDSEPRHDAKQDDKPAQVVMFR